MRGRLVLGQNRKEQVINRAEDREAVGMKDSHASSAFGVKCETVGNALSASPLQPKPNRRQKLTAGCVFFSSRIRATDSMAESLTTRGSAAPAVFVTGFNVSIERRPFQTLRVPRGRAPARAGAARIDH